MNKTKTAITFSIIFSLFSLQLSPVLAQTKLTKAEKKTAKVKEKIKGLGVGEKVKIKVKLYNDITYQGYLSEANEDNFVIISKDGNPNKLNYSDVNSVGGKNVSTGLIIGVGVGLGILATLLSIYFFAAD